MLGWFVALFAYTENDDLFVYPENAGVFAHPEIHLELLLTTLAYLPTLKTFVYLPIL